MPGQHGLLQCGAISQNVRTIVSTRLGPREVLPQLRLTGLFMAKATLKAARTGAK